MGLIPGQETKTLHAMRHVHNFLEKKNKINANEMKRRLLLGSKVMTNLDSILKSKDIILPTKVCIVRATVFPVVMYGCERP